MHKLKLAALAAAMALPASQSALAADHETTWNLSGWINEGVSYYDDGTQSEFAQLSDNGTTLGSRLTFNGDYKPEGTGLTAGFEVILEPQNANTPLLFGNQTNWDADGFGTGIGLLSHNVHVGGSWGKITLGKQSMPTDNIAVLADPSGTIWSDISPLFRGNGFFIRGLGAGAANTTWGSFAQCMAVPGLGIGIDCNGIYRNGVRYDAPAFGPVSVAVGWANDDIYDIAVKYSGEFGDMKANLHGGYAYNSNGGTNFGGRGSDTYQIQGGLMHTPTGIFGVAAYQMEEVSGVAAGGTDDTDAYYFKAGIRSKWNSFGDSALYAAYASYNDQHGNGAGITGSELTRWAIGAEQYFGPRLVVYLKYEQYDIDVDGAGAADYANAEELTLTTLGVTYFF